MSKRGATTLAGILLLDKPTGMTSHDVVAAVRRATGEGRVGHAGTLDPLATGLLVVLVGPYTRLEPYLSSADKRYEATIAFGAETDTDDSDGTVTRTADVPAELLDPKHAAGCLETIVGASEQMPPAYSAIKVGGRVAHRAARSGEALTLSSRPIEVYSARLLDVDPARLTWHVALHVSKGTYVRAIARDLGRVCGSAAHLSSLRRTASGALAVDAAMSLNDVLDAASSGTVDTLFADPIGALGLQSVEGDPRSISVGARIARAGADLRDGQAVAVTVDGTLTAVYRAEGDWLVPEAVMTAGGQR